MSCDVGHRRGSDLALLWLWCKPAAVALIGTLAWELPYAAGVALKKKNFFSTPFHDKNYHKTGNRRKLPQHDK